jgi:GntR family transcriptional regulator, transcriptional repressor for pyruvate dehydrogenase complex
MTTGTAQLQIDLTDREAVSTEIANQLLRQLLSGSVKPGERLPPERQLATMLGVGRATVRDALKLLAHHGVIKIRPGDGTYFTPSNLLPQSIEWGLLLGERQIQDLIEARRYIEVIVARLAAERRNEQTIGALSALLSEMKEANTDYARFIEADIAFHKLLSEASGNSVFADILSRIHLLLRIWIQRVFEDAGETAYSYRRHLAIFKAIEAGDAEAAEQAMAEHMESAITRLRRTLENTGTPGSSLPEART